MNTSIPSFRRPRMVAWLIALIYLILGAGLVLFFEDLKSTVTANPHPQINYVIFVVLGIGLMLVAFNTWRLRAEFNFVCQLQEWMKADATEQRSDWMGHVLAHKSGLSTSVLARAIVEIQQQLGHLPPQEMMHAELTRFKTHLQRHMLVAQQLGGLLVGLGLLGTFVGLLAALKDIGNLIGSFAVSTNNSDPVAFINGLVSNLTGPMSAMGVAFSASLFGVLGSLIMAFLILILRRSTLDLILETEAVISRIMVLELQETQQARAPLALGNNASVSLAPLMRELSWLKDLPLALKTAQNRADQYQTGLLGLLETQRETNRTLLAQSSQQQALLETVTCMAAEQSGFFQTMHKTSATQDVMCAMLQGQQTTMAQWAQSRSDEQRVWSQQLASLQSLFRETTASLQADGRVSAQWLDQMLRTTQEVVQVHGQLAQLLEQFSQVALLQLNPENGDHSSTRSQHV